MTARFRLIAATRRPRLRRHLRPHLRPLVRSVLRPVVAPAGRPPERPPERPFPSGTTPGRDIEVTRPIRDQARPGIVQGDESGPPAAFGATTWAPAVLGGSDREPAPVTGPRLARSGIVADGADAGDGGDPNVAVGF